MSVRATIAFDYSHNNKLTIEGSGYADFTQFLFSSSFQLGKIQAGFDSLQKVEKYDTLILSSPMNSTLKLEEIEILENYVRKGGNILIVSSGGGDYTNNTNLNDLTRKFGFEFVSDEISDSMNYVYLQKRPFMTKFTPHLITEQVRKVVFSSACSIRVLGFIDDDKNIKIEEIVNAGLNCWRNRYDGEDWVEEDSPKVPLLVAAEYFNGRVVAFGCHTIFSSFGREYGFSAFDNDVLIANILRWLTSGIYLDATDVQTKVINVNLNMDLYYWLEHIAKEQNWQSTSDIINVSLKYFKDNYEDIIAEITAKQLEKVKKRKEFAEKKKEKIEESAEEKILDVVLERKKKDLIDIIEELESITGEKYELSIDLDFDEEVELLNQELIKVDDLQTEKSKEEEENEVIEDLEHEQEVEEIEEMELIKEKLEEDGTQTTEEDTDVGEDLLDKEKEKEEVDYSKWTVQKLRRFCKKSEIEIPSRARKADIIKAIESWKKEETINEK